MKQEQTTVDNGLLDKITPLPTLKIIMVEH